MAFTQHKHICYGTVLVAKFSSMSQLFLPIIVVTVLSLYVHSTPAVSVGSIHHPPPGAVLLLRNYVFAYRDSLLRRQLFCLNRFSSCVSESFLIHARHERCAETQATTSRTLNTIRMFKVAFNMYRHIIHWITHLLRLRSHV